MPALAEVRQLGRRVQSMIPGRRPNPETGPKLTPLVGKALELWRVVDPERDPDITRTVYFELFYSRNAHQRTTEEIAFDRILTSVLPPDVENHPFLATLSINPESSGRLNKPQDFESCMHFQLGFWGPYLGPEGTISQHREPILRIIESHSTPNWLILSPDLKRNRDNGSAQWYDLTDYDAESGEMAWRALYPTWYDDDVIIHTGKDYKSNDQWKRKFIATNLDGLIDLVSHTKFLITDPYGKFLSEEAAQDWYRSVNETGRKAGLRGQIEFGSIADDINIGEAFGLAIGHD